MIQRPIAELMAFTACFIDGMVTYFTLPVSLLPDIAIPEITVQISAQNTSARELEHTVVKPLRQQLIQVARLKDMDSEAHDGAGLIRLNFDFGTNTDLAFIEVNVENCEDSNNMSGTKNMHSTRKAKQNNKKENISWKVFIVNGKGMKRKERICNGG